MRRLYESLLDDEEDLLDTTGDAVLSIQLNQPNTNFRRLLNPEYKAIYRRNKPIDQGLTFANKTLTVDPDRSNGPVSTKIDIRFNEESLGNYCPGIKALNCPTGDVVIETGSRPVDDSTICKTISAAGIVAWSPDKLQVKNIELNILPKSKSSNFFTYATFGSWRNMTLSNVTVNNKTNTDKTCIQFKCIPTLSNFKTKDIEYFRIYDCGLFDEVDKIWDKVFDWTYVGTPASGIPRKIKDIKKLVATANNRKKYFPGQENLYKLNDGFKLTDLIDIKGCQGLNRIIFENNNVAIFFGKDLETVKHYSYIENSILGINPGHTMNDGIENRYDIPKTADGWYCVIYKTS